MQTFKLKISLEKFIKKYNWENPLWKKQNWPEEEKGSYTVSMKVSDDIKSKCNLSIDHWNYSRGSLDLVN